MADLLGIVEQKIEKMGVKASIVRDDDRIIHVAIFPRDGNQLGKVHKNIRTLLTQRLGSHKIILYCQPVLGRDCQAFEYFPKAREWECFKAAPLAELVA